MWIARYFRRDDESVASPASKAVKRRRVLNVGGNSKAIPIPACFSGWDHALLDIDRKGNPDIVCDARELATLPAGQFDAVYCSHNLEHYYPHHTIKVLRGFVHVLKDDGFAMIKVPDIRAVMKHFVDNAMDVHDVLYVSPGGPITVHDVIYGWGRQIESSGRDFYAHKAGFTAASLRDAIRQGGFETVFISESADAFEVSAIAFKTVPTQAQRTLLGIGVA
jgi:SAM-dependent methyltransferase